MLAAAILVLARGPGAPDPESVDWWEKFTEPEVRSSRAGLLDTELTAHFDEVTLRYYKGTDTGNPITKKFIARTFEREVSGPTLQASPGDKVRVLLQNQLLDPRTNPPDKDAKFQLTNLHTHGWHVNPGGVEKNGQVVLAHDNVLITILPPDRKRKDDDPPTVVEKGMQYEYDLPVYHAPGTHWYHAHRHGSVSKQTENAWPARSS